MTKSQKCWKMIAEIGWPCDYDEAGLRLAKAYSKAEIEILRTFCYDQRDKVMRSLRRFAKSWRGPWPYPVLYDDSFGDLSCHIVGLGETETKAVVKDGKIGWERAQKKEYEENFMYVFHSASPDEE